MTKKEEAINVISNLPDSASFKDMIYELYVLEQVEKGLKDVDDGKYTSIDELESEVSNW